jgi:hypothetical protein
VVDGMWIQGRMSKEEAKQLGVEGNYYLLH